MAIKKPPEGGLSLIFCSMLSLTGLQICGYFLAHLDYVIAEFNYFAVISLVVDNFFDKLY
jgi:hypothetical protein